MPIILSFQGKQAYDMFFFSLTLQLKALEYFIKYGAKVNSSFVNFEVEELILPLC